VTEPYAKANIKTHRYETFADSYIVVAIIALDGAT
jgi:hypothetical protein